MTRAERTPIYKIFTVILADADSEIFGAEAICKDKFEVIEKYLPYAEIQLKKGVPINLLTKHLMGFFHGMPSAKKYRADLSKSPLLSKNGMSRQINWQSC